MIQSHDQILAAGPPAGGGSRSSRRGEQTRRRLLCVAERLFADHGVHAVSLRAVNAAAQVGPAGVHYHFRSKQGLLQAVVEHRGAAVLQDIRRRAAVLAARDRPPDARDLVELIAAPYLDLLDAQPVHGLRWIRVIAQLALSDDGLIREASAELAPVLLAQVRRAYPHVPLEILRVRWTLTAFTTIQMLSHAERWLDAEGTARVERQHFIDELVAFAAGGLEAVREQSLRDAARPPDRRSRPM